jgi:DedD protein
LDSLVKERLTGAIILVVLIVLLVPELLSGPSRPAPAPQAAASSPSSSEDPPLRSYTIDLADESHGATPSPGTTTNVPTQASEAARPSTILEHPAQDASTVQQTPAPGPADEASPQESQQPAQATAPIAPSPKESMRPAPAAAHQPRPPADKSSPVPHLAVAGAKRPTPLAERPGAAEKPAPGGWVVQVGVFAKRANAERLVRDLQEQGFRTQISENTSGGRTLWWVRTGAVAERAAAEQLSARLRAAGHAGSIVPK